VLDSIRDIARRSRLQQAEYSTAGPTMYDAILARTASASWGSQVISMRGVCAEERVHLPPSRDTSSMSDVTDILCAVRSGDFSGAASPLGVSAAPSTFFGMLGTSGTGESALLDCAAEDEESGRLSSDREDRERSECESGRGVISEASSKSCRHEHY
jgi:hypothetical protein